MSKIPPKHKLYNFISSEVLNRVDFANTKKRVLLTVDKYKNKKEIKIFNQHLINNLETILPLNINLDISHERSHENTGLQAVDLFCWGIFRKYEQNDLKWYDIFKEKIIFDGRYL